MQVFRLLRFFGGSVKINDGFHHAVFRQKCDGRVRKPNEAPIPSCEAVLRKSEHPDHFSRLPARLASCLLARIAPVARRTQEALESVKVHRQTFLWIGLSYAPSFIVASPVNLKERKRTIRI
jgi:hypothetical protein